MVLMIVTCIFMGCTASVTGLYRIVGWPWLVLSSRPGQSLTPSVVYAVINLLELIRENFTAIEYDGFLYPQSANFA